MCTQVILSYEISTIRHPEIIMYTPISFLYTIKTVVWQKGQSIDLVLSRQRKYSCSRTPGIQMS